MLEPHLKAQFEKNGKMTNTLRNQKSNGNPTEPCRQAFDYDDDVTPEAIEYLRKKAEKTINDGNWKVISGNAFTKS